MPLQGTLPCKLFWGDLSTGTHPVTENDFPSFSWNKKSPNMLRKWELWWTPHYFLDGSPYKLQSRHPVNGEKLSIWRENNCQVAERPSLLFSSGRGVWRQLYLDFRVRQLGELGWGAPMGKARPPPCTDFWNRTWGLGQSSGQSLGLWSIPSARTCRGAFRNAFVCLQKIFFLTLSIVTWSIYTKKHPKQNCADQGKCENHLFQEWNVPASPEPASLTAPSSKTTTVLTSNPIMVLPVLSILWVREV